MTDSEKTVTDRHNGNGKHLVFGDGMGMVSSGAMVVTDKKNLAVRNAIESHRLGDRKPLAFCAENIRYLSTDTDQ